MSHLGQINFPQVYLLEHEVTIYEAHMSFNNRFCTNADVWEGRCITACACVWFFCQNHLLQSFFFKLSFYVSLNFFCSSIRILLWGQKGKTNSSEWLPGSGEILTACFKHPSYISNVSDRKRQGRLFLVNWRLFCVRFYVMKPVQIEKQQGCFLACV